MTGWAPHVVRHCGSGAGAALMHLWTSSGAAFDCGASLCGSWPYCQVVWFVYYLGRIAFKFMKCPGKCPNVRRKEINASASSFAGVASSQ